MGIGDWIEGRRRMRSILLQRCCAGMHASPQRGCDPSPLSCFAPLHPARALAEGWPMPPPGTGHLWLLYYLLLTVPAPHPALESLLPQF
jgi:hypothetical protein